MDERRWIVYCPVAGFETEPMTQRQAEDLLECGESLHAFEGHCAADHDMAWVPE